MQRNGDGGGLWTETYLDEAHGDVFVGELVVAEVLAAEAAHEGGQLLVLLHLLPHPLDLLGHVPEPLHISIRPEQKTRCVLAGSSSEF